MLFKYFALIDELPEAEYTYIFASFCPLKKYQNFPVLVHV